MMARVIASGLLIGMMATACAGHSAGPETAGRILADHEAQLLVYLLPGSEWVRDDGREIQITIIGGNPNRDCIEFHLSDPGGPGDTALYGRFGVDLRTAEIYSVDTFAELETTPTIRGVQEILRRAHEISRADVEAGRGRCYNSQPNE